jgi:hypothetical protein
MTDDKSAKALSAGELKRMGERFAEKVLSRFKTILPLREGGYAACRLNRDDE